MLIIAIVCSVHHAIIVLKHIVRRERDCCNLQQFLHGLSWSTHLEKDYRTHFHWRIWIYSNGDVDGVDNAEVQDVGFSERVNSVEGTEGPNSHLENVTSVSGG